MRTQRNLLSSLFDHLSMGNTVWDQDGNLLQANKGFTVLSGYSRDGVKCIENWFSLVYPDPDYRQMISREWVQTRHEKNVVREFKITSRERTVKDVECQLSLMPDGNAFVTMTDISARKQAEVERDQLQSQLRHFQKMEAIGTLDGGIAHDFNNILSAVIGYADLLQMKLQENP